METKRTIIISVAGASSSGKTLLAKTIINELSSSRVAMIPEDSYYKDLSHLSLEERAKVNFDHPDSLDHELLIEHLQQLQAGKMVDIPIYDHNEHKREKETRRLGKQNIVILEGILLFADPIIRELSDIKIFMDTPLDICLMRRLKRDIVERSRTVESVLEQYEATVRPMFQQFVEPSKRYADIIVPRGGLNKIAIDMIKIKIQELLGKTPEYA